MSTLRSPAFAVASRYSGVAGTVVVGATVVGAPVLVLEPTTVVGSGSASSRGLSPPQPATASISTSPAAGRNRFLQPTATMLPAHSGGTSYLTAAWALPFDDVVAGSPALRRPIMPT